MDLVESEIEQNVVIKWRSRLVMRMQCVNTNAAERLFNLER